MLLNLWIQFNNLFEDSKISYWLSYSWFTFWGIKLTVYKRQYTAYSRGREGIYIRRMHLAIITNKATFKNDFGKANLFYF